MLRACLAYLRMLSVSMLLCAAAFGGSHSPAEYPLRVHIFERSSHSHYHHESLERVDGEGRANLYQGGEPRGFDFSYHCDDRIRRSVGYETFMARWKKPNQTLEVLQPKLGKPGSMEACELKVEMKDVVYYVHRNSLETEPATVFKQWMEKHQYDPEHDKDEPVNLSPEEAGAKTDSPE